MSKAPWFKAKFPNGRPREKKRVNPISKSRNKRMAEYIKVRDPWMLKHRYCEVPGCRSKSIDPHHSRGKVGSLLTDTRFWIAVCRPCHSWVGNHPAKARSMGLICAEGLWNKPDKTPHANLDNR